MFDTLPAVPANPIPVRQPEWIGPELPKGGLFKNWIPGLQALLARGPSCFQALTALGLSAGSWGSRLIARRNPVIGLVDESSRGKGSVINYALSIWTPPSLLTIPAGSTAKGLQDRAVMFPDWPIFADELQQLRDRDQNLVADAIYFLGNGQRRVTSSRDQTARGGDRRYGCGFFAAESPVTPGLNMGVQYRVWELDGPPLPYPDPELAAVLQRSSSHPCAPGARITRYMIESGLREPEWTAFLQDRLEVATATYGGLAGDDHVGLTLVRWGLELLERVSQRHPETTVQIPTLDIIDWLADRLKVMRTKIVDKDSQAWGVMMDVVLNSEPDGQRLTRKGEVVAWITRADDLITGLEIDTTAAPVAIAIGRFGTEAQLVRGWGGKGWLVRQGEHWKVKRRIEGSMGRAIRLSEKALSALNRNVP